MKETERAVLGCILSEPRLVHDAISAGITPTHFGSIANAKIYEVMRDMAREEIGIDFITLRDTLDSRGHLDTVGNVSYLTQLDIDLPDTAMFDDYLDQVRASGLRRRVVEAGKNLTRIPEGAFSSEELLSQMQQQVAEVMTLAGRSTQPLRMGDAVGTLVKDIRTGWNPGIPTHYTSLDVQLSGLRPGNFVVIAGRPGMGKTALAVNMAHQQCAIDKTKVAIFSLEMSAEELGLRILTAQSQIPMQKIKMSALSDHEWSIIEESQSSIDSFDLYVEDRAGTTMDQLASKARELCNNKGVEVIYIDYLQLMDGERGHSNRQEAVSQISRRLKLLAKELNIPIVVMCQLNREVEKRPDRRPRLSDLRESGSIEQDADSVIMVYRPGEYKEQDDTGGKTSLLIEKNRHGPTGSVTVFWHPETQQFLNP